MRLGQASVIQDYDISLRADTGDLGIEGPWKNVVPLWIRLAMIQGRVYEYLYSPAALCQSESERVGHAERLADEMRWGVMEPFERLTLKAEVISDIDSLYLKFDRVCRLSVLALIYRAIPPKDVRGTFTGDCIETARAALESHQACMASMKDNDTLKCSYMHWTILYAPFVPFIVLFCHIIEFSSDKNQHHYYYYQRRKDNKASTTTATSDDRTTEAEVGHDLSRLEEFVCSLEPLASPSEAITKLHRLCQVLVIIARLYTEAKAKSKERARTKAASQISSYTEAEAEMDNERENNNNDDSENDGNDSINDDMMSATNNNNNDDNDNTHFDLVQMGQEFDIYLSALGFAPDQSGSGTGIEGMGMGLAPAAGFGGSSNGPASSGMISMGMNMGSGIGASSMDTDVDTEMMGMMQPSNQQQRQDQVDPVPVTRQLSPPSMLQSTQLGNWFSGNRYMMGLLEEDLSQFDPSSWGI